MAYNPNAPHVTRSRHPYNGLQEPAGRFVTPAAGSYQNDWAPQQGFNRVYEEERGYERIGEVGGRTRIAEYHQRYDDARYGYDNGNYQGQQHDGLHTSEDPAYQESEQSTSQRTALESGQRPLPRDQQNRQVAQEMERNESQNKVGRPQIAGLYSQEGLDGQSDPRYYQSRGPQNRIRTQVSERHVEAGARPDPRRNGREASSKDASPRMTNFDSPFPTFPSKKKAGNDEVKLAESLGEMTISSVSAHKAGSSKNLVGNRLARSESQDDRHVQEQLNEFPNQYSGFNFNDESAAHSALGNDTYSSSTGRTAVLRGVQPLPQRQEARHMGSGFHARDTNHDLFARNEPSTDTVFVSKGQRAQTMPSRITEQMARSQAGHQPTYQQRRLPPLAPSYGGPMYLPLSPPVGLDNRLAPEQGGHPARQPHPAGNSQPVSMNPRKHGIQYRRTGSSDRPHNPIHEVPGSSGYSQLDEGNVRYPNKATNGVLAPGSGSVDYLPQDPSCITRDARQVSSPGAPAPLLEPVRRPRDPLLDQNPPFYDPEPPADRYRQHEQLERYHSAPSQTHHELPDPGFGYQQSSGGAYGNFGIHQEKLSQELSHPNRSLLDEQGTVPLPPPHNPRLIPEARGLQSASVPPSTLHTNKQRNVSNTSQWPASDVVGGSRGHMLQARPFDLVQRSTNESSRTGSAPPAVVPRYIAPDALPQHPAPIRPGLLQQQSPPPQPPKPPPVRQYRTDNASNQAPSGGQQPSSSERPSLERGAPNTVTYEEIERLRNAVKANPSDYKQQLALAQRLVQAASVLADENGRADLKTRTKNREKYVFEAHKLVKKLVSNGFPDATFYLADCYGQGMLGLEPDMKEAFSLYQSAAKLGHPAAAYRTAVCCEMGAEDGGGTRKDPLKAVQWYKRAANLGDTAAMYKMGMITLNGLLGQPQSIAEAINWLKRAVDRADKENPHALHQLALLYETANANDRIIRDEKYALQLFTQAAQLGYKFSQFRLGQAYEYGQMGCAVDPRQSIAWYSRAAAQGEHQSELALSGWYLTGSENILPHNETEAYLWARKAATAEPPLAKALFAMGYYTEVGIGCPSSLEEAKRWYTRAAAYKFPKAQERLEELKKGGARVQKHRERLSRSNQRQHEENCAIM